MKFLVELDHEIYQAFAPPVDLVFYAIDSAPPRYHVRKDFCIRAISLVGIFKRNKAHNRKSPGVKSGYRSFRFVKNFFRGYDRN